MALALQLLLLKRWTLKARRLLTHGPGISVLKPLCGLDPALVTNLLSFVDLDYDDCEVLLGVKDEEDPAYIVARRFAETFPHRFRLVVQRSSPGMNPKVNQLITLARFARHDLLVVSDSNVRVGRDYLCELAAEFEDSRVGCVTNPIVGTDEPSVGAILERLHLGSSIGPAMVAAPMISGQYLIVGKSMAVRRSALNALGGFEAFCNHLAEDYAIGRAMAEAGMGLRVARTACVNVCGHKSARDFWARFARWSVIHRTAISLPTYLAQALMNPAPLAAVAFALAPSRPGAIFVLAAVLLKIVLDGRAVHALSGRAVFASLGLVPFKDALLFAAWVRGLFVRTVEWRGNQLRVGPGSKLVAPATATLVEEVS